VLFLRSSSKYTAVNGASNTPTVIRFFCVSSSRVSATKETTHLHSVKHEEGPDGKKEEEKQAFLKLYGGQRSALTFLFKECEITPWVQFQTKMIFPGSAQYSRFRSLFNNNILPANAAAIQRLGIEPKDIGVHSIRKGAATYCCNGDGTTAGVAFCSVSVRAGFSLVV
jgi:hypothetical protein